MHEHFFNFRIRYFIILYELMSKQDLIHTSDVAKALQISLPATSIMLRKLKAEGYIIKPSFQEVALSESGYELAKKYYLHYQQLIIYFSNIPGFTIDDQIESAIICLGAFPEARINKMIEPILDDFNHET